MGFEIDRLHELDSLIRAAHAELGSLQIQLMEAHERDLNPAELGVDVADLGQKILVWKREKGALCRSIAESARAVTPIPGDDELGPARLAGKYTAGYPRKGSTRRLRSTQAIS